MMMSQAVTIKLTVCLLKGAAVAKLGLQIIWSVG
ncbi:hypothetical protein SAMN05421578_102514 [Paenibacillus macquariensis]|uniref:Uncharacterized protein n=1 Tax=Paenibacillus macquariensis TaxID=948756 RepID=A0ABY1JPM6_9BACL|nr:hypothetical protein SAMN05421578_102514 [Paenibacillus macquariensis]